MTTRHDNSSPPDNARGRSVRNADDGIAPGATGGRRALRHLIDQDVQRIVRATHEVCQSIRNASADAAETGTTRDA